MNIELVIKIPEEDYERVKKKFQMRMNIMANAIAHGKPLPKGHGRLIDADKLLDENVDNFLLLTKTEIRIAPTIIEADKESDKEE